MNTANRAPLHIDPQTSCLLMIDIQTRLLPAIAQSDRLLDNSARLLQAAKALEIPLFTTEQAPQRLGATLDTLSQLCDGQLITKTTFDACRNPELIQALGNAEDVVVFGVETHVCVLQTALSLLQHGKRVWVVIDACSSRTEANKSAGLQRLQAAGATLVSTEMVLFEWIQDANHPKFRQLSQLIKE